MSVIIRGMQAPHDCRVCPMLGYESDIGRSRCVVSCRLLAEHFKAIPFDGRPDWCPLVELPEKHGRLIDADELLKKIDLAIAIMKATIKNFDLKDAKFQMELKAYQDIRNGIKDEQTVVEAEYVTMEKIRPYEIKRRCDNPRFLVITTCQGQPYYYMHHSLIGAVLNYCKQYLTKRKYGTMNFKLRKVMITDMFMED